MIMLREAKIVYLREKIEEVADNKARNSILKMI
jgi:hypothetical protein